jgi:hypothetical protein
MSIIDKKYSITNKLITSNNELNYLISNYKIIYIPINNNVYFKIYEDEYFIRKPYKINIIKEMINYFPNQINSDIYFCNEKEKICICKIKTENIINEPITIFNEYKYIYWYKEQDYNY